MTEKSKLIKRKKGTGKADSGTEKTAETIYRAGKFTDAI